jgi:hypothetical protein
MSTGGIVIRATRSIAAGRTSTVPSQAGGVLDEIDLGPEGEWGFGAGREPCRLNRPLRTSGAIISHCSWLRALRSAHCQ